MVSKEDYSCSPDCISKIFFWFYQTDVSFFFIVSFNFLSVDVNVKTLSFFIISNLKTNGFYVFALNLYFHTRMYNIKWIPHTHDIKS